MGALPAREMGRSWGAAAHWAHLTASGGSHTPGPGTLLSPLNTTSRTPVGQVSAESWTRGPCVTLSPPRPLTTPGEATWDE